MSASTPESKIKKKIKTVLDKYKAEGHMYYYMPVPGGYGASTLDYLGFFYGLGWAIEAKPPGGKPTDRQKIVIEQIRASRARVFVINDDETLTEFEDWLNFINYYYCSK
jgi:hypothetical protein